MKNKAEIGDIEVNYDVVHRNIKYPRLEIKTGNLILILPQGYNNHQELIKKHKKWIYNKISLINSSHNKKLHNRTEEELKVALSDSKKQKLPCVFDIKVAPGSMTKGYSSWWRVGVAAVSEDERVKEAYLKMKKNISIAREY